MRELPEDTKDWVRHGECDGCGYCCEVIAHAHVNFNHTGDPEWMEVRGIPKNGIKWIAIVDPCPKLDEETKECTIYEDRPQLCQDFPVHPQDIQGIPCIYWFENLVTGKKIGGTRSPHPFVTNVVE